MIRLFNKICLIGGGAFSTQLLQDIDYFKYQISFNNKKIFLNSFYTMDSRELQLDKKHLYLITVAKPNVKEKIFNQLDGFNFLDTFFIDSSVSKSIVYGKNLIIWKSFIGNNVIFKNNIYIGPYSIIAKNSIIEDNVSVYPRVSILKNSWIKKNTVIGTNSVITDNIVIGENCLIGSNKTIYENIPDNSIII
jgi:acetyltransferase-like isoleucine patch superfamily enzyme